MGVDLLTWPASCGDSPGELAEQVWIDVAKDRLRGISERRRAQSFDTDMASLRYYGERDEVAPCLAARGWVLTGTTIRDLLAAHDLPPLSDDDARMGDMLYVSGTR